MSDPVSPEANLHILHVYIDVKADCVPAFVVATRANAAASLQEPGVLRFDVVQEVTRPTHFVLLEVYRDTAAHAAHRQTAHYLQWRQDVDDMMAKPRVAQTYTDVFPAAQDW